MGLQSPLQCTVALFLKGNTPMQTALAIIGTAAVSSALQTLIPEGHLLSLILLAGGTVALTFSVFVDLSGE